MFDRVTKGYLWVMLCMAFAVGTTSFEAKNRDAAIDTATRAGLIRGLWSGCSELANPARTAIQGVIAQMEAAEVGDEKYGSAYWDRLRALAPPLDCDDYARERVSFYSPPPVILPEDTPSVVVVERP